MTTLQRAARDSFIADNRCDEHEMTPRPDLVPSGHVAPTEGQPGTEAWEIRGCNLHQLYVCSTLRECRAITFCDLPRCSEDYIANARAMFAHDQTCPLDRVGAALTSEKAPHAPSDVAADAQRLELWQQRLQSSLALASAHREILVTAGGCNAEVVYACKVQAPGAPRCEPTGLP